MEAPTRSTTRSPAGPPTRTPTASYSYYPNGYTPAMRDQLAASVGGRVYFAGEATSRPSFATVHGAYNSGIRAAKEVLAP